MSVNKNLFKIFDKVDSTNNYAMGKVHEGSWKHGNACFSWEQTAGKGTRGKHWQSNKGENIMLSIVVDTSFLSISQQFYLSAVAALACYDLIIKYAKGNIKIKWPNDLFWNDRKAAGILIENVIKGDSWQWAVVGIGININQASFSEETIKPVSLKQITGKTFEVVELAEELYSKFFERFGLIKMGKFDAIMKEYNHHLFHLHEKTRLKKGRVIFESTIKGVSADGKLLTKDAIERSFDFNEVEWII